MADSKITALTALTAADPANDMIPIVDVSDTPPASGNTKRISINNILACSPSATLASATITGDLTVRTNKLAVTSTGVGINGTSAAYPLEINGGASASTSQFKSTGASVIARFTDGTAETGYIGSGIALISGISRTDFGIASNGALVFGVSTGLAMTLNSTGLGVGVTPSAWLSDFRALQVSSSGSYLTSYISGATVNQWLFIGNNAFYDSVDSRWEYIRSKPSAQYIQYNNEHQWLRDTGTQTAGAACSFTQAMTLDASGNLLVGTTSAGGRLDVQTATGDCAARIKSNAAGSNATLSIDYVNSYGTQIIRKSGTDVWLSGVIADTGATPNYKIQNGSAVGVQLVSGATAWTTLSDETVKDIIEPIGNAVAKVGSLRSVIGKFKTDSEGTRRSFLIAQDVKSVLPEAVDVVGENNELGLRYTEVIPLLVAAIKELSAEVNALKNA